MRNKYIEDISIEGRLKEIDIKLKRVRKMLDENNLEGLLLTKHPNFSWITAGGKNFVANCFDAGEVTVLITKTDQFVFCNIMEEPRIRVEEQIEELGFKMEVYPWQVNKLEEFVSNHVPLDKVLSDTARTSVVINDELIKSLRLELTDNEIARYLHLGDVMSEELEKYLATVKPGMSEYEIAGGVSNVLMARNVEQVMLLVSFDERSLDYRHALPTDKKLEKNLIVSVNGRYKGLVATVSRMVHIGEPDPSFLKQYRDCVEMETLVMSKAEVGNKEIDLYDTLYQAYIDKGYPTMFDRHGQGGLQGYWPREYLITPDKHGIIEANRAYCFNPVVDGTKAEDPFIVTDEGVLLITGPKTFPKLRYEFNGKEYIRPDMLIIK